MIVDEGLADHIDMNFGCPVPKVTRRGGGAALPVQAQAVRADRRRRGARHRGHRGPGDGQVPDRHRRRASHPPGRRPDRRRRRARLRSRCTPAPRRSATPGAADWEQIAALQAARHGRFRCSATATSSTPTTPLAMMATTGCDGVVIGRGCLGRPWLFAELSARSTGAPAAEPPTLGEVAHDHPPARRAAERPFRRGQGHARHPQTHRLVSAWLPRGSRPPPGVGAGQDAGRTGRAAGRTGPRGGVSRGRDGSTWAGRVPRRRWRCRRAGWPIPTTAQCPPERMLCTPVAEPRRFRHQGLSGCLSTI